MSADFLIAAVVGIALEQIERADERSVENVARLLVDQRHVERLLDTDHLGA